MKLLLIILTFFCVLYTSASGWIEKADFGGVARHRTTGLAMGNKVYIGLGHYNGAGTNVLFNDWWEYDPSTNAWTQKADYLGGICYHATGFAINDIGYVGTGRISPSGSTLVSSFYKYDPSTNVWSVIPSLPGVARRGAVAFTIGEEGYIGTGETNTGSTSTFYKYTPATNSWTTINPFPGGARTSSVAFSIENYGYVGTGNANFGSTNDFWRYDPITNNWMQMASVGPTSRQEATGFSVNGKGYIGTGDDYSSGNNYKDMWEYDPSLNQWVQIEDFRGTARRYLQSVQLGEYAYAGLGTSGTNFKDFWIFDQKLSILEKTLDKMNFVVFPNPADEKVSINITNDALNDDYKMRVEIYSLMGQKLISQEVTFGNNEINTSRLSNGTYVYSISFHDVALKTGQLIVNTSSK